MQPSRLGGFQEEHEQTAGASLLGRLTPAQCNPAKANRNRFSINRKTPHGKLKLFCDDPLFLCYHHFDW